MKLKAVCICLLWYLLNKAVIGFRRSVLKELRYDNVMDVEDFSVYYDMETNKTVHKLMPRPWYTPGWRLRFPFSGGRCNCETLKCTCCTGIRINAFNFDRKTCAILTYDPTPSTIDLLVKMNNDSIYQRTFSARNPPPFCVPVVVPYLPPGLVDFCIRLFDISIVNQMLHVCMDMDTRIDKAPVVILHFDCMDMGFSGVSLSKPGSEQTTTPLTLVAHDEVFEENLETTTCNVQQQH
ncbi:hypothetical protein ACJJTC_010249 [Scirpophaga incertulas]